jgi:hypothetical protein
MKLDTVKQYLALRGSLLQEKASLEARLADINKALADRSAVGAPSVAPVAAPAAPRVRRRPRVRRVQNEMTLKEAVTQVTKSKPLTKPEILEAIDKLGYRFATKTPMNSLDMLLYKRGNFKRNGKKFSPA